MTESHIDEVDRRLLYALAVDGRAPFSRVAEVLGVSDQTVARRYRRLRRSAGLRIVCVRDHELVPLDTWTLRLRCTPDAAYPLARVLARRPDTTWVGLTSAGTEVVCLTGFRTQGEHEELILGKLPRTPSIVEIRAQLLLHRFYGGPMSWLLKEPGLLSDEQTRALLPPWRESAEETGAVRLGPEDERLVRVLEQDGRATFAELQQATGRTESSLRRRLDQLLRSRALYVDTEFDSAALGYGARAILWITTGPSALDRVGRAMAGHREVAFATATTGDSNLMAVIVCRDTASVYRYLNEELGRLDGVQHVEVAPTLRSVKQLTYEEARPGALPG